MPDAAHATSDRITETDILDGRWDNAEVELWRVNWTDTGQRVLLRRGAIGQVRRGRVAFVAEVRSLAHVLGQTVGRTFQSTCDAALSFTAEKTEEAVLCRCKATGDAPFCDGTHAGLGDKEAGDPVPESAGGAPDAAPTPEEPTVARIHALAKDGLSRLGRHGEVAAMGVPRKDLPHWDDIQILTAQMARKPLADDDRVATSVSIGPRARKPLDLSIPLFVTDMSLGALSEEAKTALARGAELAGTGICSGEGGMLPEEQQENSRYLYELASARFGWDPELVERVHAFHFKGGQGAKTGIGGKLSGEKVQGRVAEIRGLQEGEASDSPATFPDLRSPADFLRVADEVRERSGGIPIGFKLSANHIEDDIDFALEAGADYIILDGRGGGTGGAPLLFRDHISVPTIPALARARRHLDAKAGREVTLVMTGGMRVAEDFVKALALGADAVAVGNSAIQAVGCVAARICNTNNCPAGVFVLLRREGEPSGINRIYRLYREDGGRSENGPGDRFPVEWA